MESNLGNKIVKGTFWVVAARLCLRGLSVISTIVLAWLLTPADFGIVAMASIVTSLMLAFTEVGMNQVIIYYQNDEKSFYDTAWTIQMIRGVFLGLSLLLFSNVIATFFNEQLLIPVLRVLSLVFIFNGMVSINVVVFQKEMRFDKEFYYKILTQGICLVGTITLAFWLRSYWAMVIGNIIFALSCVVLSYFYAPGFSRPTLVHWRKIFSFSQWVFLREASSQISLQLDQIMIGRWFDKTALGQYEMATQIATLPATEIALPLSRSLFPALAKLQSQSEEFRHIFSMSLAAILLITLPASCGLIIVANPLVLFLLPPRWEQIGVLIQILTIYGMVRVTFGPCASALIAKGKIKEDFLIGIFNIILKYGILYLGYIHKGLFGVAWGVVISGSITTTVYLWRAHYHNHLDFSFLLKLLWRPIIATVIMVGCVHCIKQIIIILNYGPSIEFAAMVVAGVVVYIIVLSGLWWISGKPVCIETRLLTMLMASIKKFKERLKEF